MKQLTILISTFCLLLLGHTMTAQTLSEQSRISLMTCTPGQPLYQHFGHSALRVYDPALMLPDSTVREYDMTFNYGIFSFDTDHFYWKFAKGHTDYQLGIEYTAWFLYYYEREEREAFEQVLDLTLAQRQQVFDALIENYRPENRIYRYNFVFDNCATRPLRLIQQAVPEWQVPEQMLDVTWRDQITYYSGKWDWGEFAINLAFGRDADQPITLEQSLFLPENLMRFVHESGIAKEEHTGVFVPRDASFWTSPYLVLLLLCFLLCAQTWYDIKKNKVHLIMDGTLFFVYGILGLILGFLMFFSSHPLVENNVNLLYLNPLWLVFWGLCFSRKGQAIILRSSLYILFYIVFCGCVLGIVGQTFHPLLILPILHAIRLYIIHKI